MYILKSNLISALQIAILERQEAESCLSPTHQSGFVDGLISIKEGLERGEHVEILEVPPK